MNIKTLTGVRSNREAQEASYSVANLRPIPNLGWDGKTPSESLEIGFLHGLWLSSIGSVSFTLSDELSDNTAHGRLYYEDAQGNTRYTWLVLTEDSQLTNASLRMAYHILQDALSEGIAATSVFLFPTDWGIKVEYPLVGLDQGLLTQFINLKNKGQ